MTAWTNYVKQYAKDKGITYKNALKDPACASSYKSGKDKPSVPAEPTKEDNIQMTIKEKPKRGRPRKYYTQEEAKKAKSTKTMESNKRKKAEKNKNKSNKDADSGSDIEGGAIIGKPIGMPNPLASSKTEKEIIKELKGKGILSAGYTTENTSGLAHIYPISHELVLQMLSCCPKKNFQ
jgi:hypothetical protein